MTTSNINEPQADMWTLRAKNLIHVLRQVWPKSSDAERIKRGSLSTLARMERNKSCKKKSLLALSSYLDDLPCYRKGAFYRADEQHGYLISQCTYIFASARTQSRKKPWKQAWVRKALDNRPHDRLPRGMSAHL